MKILLTGPPRSGKTTLLARFLETVPNNQGFVTEEILENGERVGFRLVSSANQTATLASVESDSPVRVSRYGVELRNLDNFIETLPPIEPNNLLYIDEIGRMELYSEKFKKLVLKYLAADNPFIGTITSIYNDDFVREIKSRPDISVTEVTEKNRETLLNQLSDLVFGAD